MKILVLNGPNLNLLGLREPDVYGAITLDEINLSLQALAKALGVQVDFFQSNHEGSIIDYLQDLQTDALIINAGAYTHTSIAIRDALVMLSIPKVEVHLSDVDNREDFRKINYIRDVVDYHVVGKKEQSYIEAIRFLLKNIEI